MIKISRDDIRSDKIVDFPVEKRFIKLPIVPYLKMLGAYKEINKPQIALINAINNPKYRFVTAALSRRIGKTYMSNIIGQLVSLVPNSNILVISPNYNLSSISFELQRKFIRHFKIELERDNLKDKVIELANGSTIRMGSVSSVDSVVGRSYDLIVFDEAALDSGGKEAFNVQLRPTLDKVNAKTIFISTPRGKRNWFSEFYNRGWSDDFPEWASINADCYENPRITERDINEAKRSMSQAEFEQEYLASFTSFEGRVYNSFKVDRDVKAYIPGSVDNPIFIAGLDPGYRDKTAFIVLCVYYETIQYEEGDVTIVEDVANYWVVDEYLERGNTSDHAKSFRKFIDLYDIDDIFIDSAAAQVGADLASMYDISTNKSNKSKLPGISFIQNITERGGLKVSPHCVHTLDAIDQYRWNLKDNLKREDTLHDYSDLMDAMRYAMYTYTT